MSQAQVASAGEQTLARCEGVARTFGHGTSAVVAAHDVNCEVRGCTSIALLGRSGSGKSTLLHLLAGVDSPTMGEVTWPALGERATLRPRLVGIVFQQANLLAPLDAMENVALPLLLAGHDPASARDAARSALTQLGLDEVANKLPEEMSGGQAQRVSIARAFVIRPKLLLADEPTGQLDHQSATTVITALLDVARAAGASVVVATHDESVASRFDETWTMVDGRLTIPGALACSA
ncbi:MAG: transporter related protein [Actinomycetia bacterium]|nr:transporter related protein [Actinomycetes bacterium]